LLTVPAADAEVEVIATPPFPTDLAGGATVTPLSLRIFSVLDDKINEYI
jgi:hypothetical protein